MLNFSPTLEHQKAYRNALGQYATGVTVVTCCRGDEPFGITINSFTSVSLYPALILWCLAQNSERYNIFATAQYFAVHVLSAQNVVLCRAFADSASAFHHTSYQRNDKGVPLLDDYLCRLECKHWRDDDGGDHRIILGQVERVSVCAAQPLVFAQGRLGTFQSLAVSLDD